MKLFKHEHSQYVRTLLEHDTFRIGTLYDFRKNEHGVGIADSLEGSKYINGEVDEYGPMGGAGTRDTLPEKLGSIYVDDSSVIDMGGAKFGGWVHHPDCFVICLSMANSEEARQSAGERDSTMQVIDLERLAQTVGRFLANRFGVDFNWEGNACEYIPRIEKLHFRSKDLGKDPIFIKGDDAKYIDQKEYRIAFSPVEPIGDIKPIIDTIPGISQCFKQVQGD